MQAIVTPLDFRVWLAMSRLTYSMVNYLSVENLGLSSKFVKKKKTLTYTILLEKT